MKGFMKKKVILPVTAVIVGGALMTPVANAVEVQNRRLGTNESIHATVFSKINPNTRELGFQFNRFEDLKVAIGALYVAAYDAENYTTKMVEAQLEQLGAETATDPVWADGMTWVKLPKAFGGTSSTTITLSRTPWLLSNRPGALYYAMQVFEKASPNDPIWYRGKIDYRACVQGGKDDTGALYACEGKLINNGTEMLFTRTDTGETGQEGAVAWGEEWEETLKARLVKLNEDISKWEGDESEKAQITAKAEKIALLADDAADKKAVLDKVDEVKAALVLREKVLNGEVTEETGDEEIKKPVVPEGGEQGGAGIMTGGQKPSGMGGSTNKTETKKPDSKPEEKTEAVTVAIVPKPTEVVEQKAPVVAKTQAVTTKRNNVATVVQPESKKDAMKEKETEDSQEKIAATEVVGQKEELEVPKLHDEATGWKWYLWLILAGAVGMLGAIIWWLKRAFGEKKR